MSFPTFNIHGKIYAAFKVSDGLWMVKEFERLSSPEDENNYREAEIEVATEDPVEAIHAAIRRGSWS